MPGLTLKSMEPEHTVNPIRELRKSLGLTQQAFATRVGMSPMAVLRYEQGCYTDPSDKIAALAHEVEFCSPAALGEGYSNYQTAKRRANYGLLDPDFNFSRLDEHNRTADPLFVWHPLSEWRSDSAGSPSLTAVCKEFCIHLAVIHKFENHPAAVSAVPTTLLDALGDAGYIKQLSALVHSYTVFLNRKFSFKVGLREHR